MANGKDKTPDETELPEFPGNPETDGPDGGWNGAEASLDDFSDLEIPGTVDEDDEWAESEVEGEDALQSAIEAFANDPNDKAAKLAALLGDRNHRISDIPMWKQYNLRKGEAWYALRIQRMNDIGRREELGELPPDAGISMLVHRYKKPGRYLIMPVNAHGKEMMKEPQIVDIPRDHPMLIAMREDMMGEDDGGGAVYMPGAGGIDGGMLDYLSRREDRDLEERKWRDGRADKDKEIVERERGRLYDVQAQIGRESTSQATTLFAKMYDTDRQRQAAAMQQSSKLRGEAEQRLTQTFDRLSQGERENSKRAMDQQQGFFAGMLQMNTQSMERERSRMENERIERKRQDEIDRERRQQNRDEERRRYDLRLEREREEERSRDRRREEDRKERQAGAEARLERQAREGREHSAMMLQLMQQKSDNNNPLSGVMTAMVAAKPIMDLLGIDTSDLGEGLRNVIGGGGGGGVINEIGETVRALIKAGAAMPAIDMMPEGEWVEDEEGNPVQLTAEQQAQIEMQQAQEAEHAEAEAIANQQTTNSMGQAVGGPAAMAALHGQSAAPAAPPQAPTKATHPSDALPKEVKVGGRRAVSMLVHNLKANEHSAWPAVIGQVWQATGDVLGPYLQAVTIRRAAREAGAETELVEAFIAQLDTLGVAPELPRG